MKRLSACFRLLIFLFCGSSIALADLNGEINAVLADKLLAKAVVGVQIIHLGNSADDSPRIFKHGSDVPLIPASNLKIVTTSAALEGLGSDFRFKTMLIYRDGDLVLVGDGDPTLGDAEFLKKVGWDSTTLFRNWADGLKKRGITSIKNVIVDDSVFEETFVHPHWPMDQLHKRYMAGVAGLNLNANCLDFYITPNGLGQRVNYVADPATSLIHVVNSCVGGRENAVWLSRMPNGSDIILKGQTNEKNDKPISVTVADPPMFAGGVLAGTLSSSGISVTGTVLRDRTIRQTFASQTSDTKPKLVLLAVHDTPITSVIARANKDSMNLYAECLGKRLGFADSGKPGSWETGTAATAKFLRAIGISAGQYALDDGCGLSKLNHISADAICKVLMHDYFGPNRDPFLKSLAIAGIDGTMDDRFKGTDLKGRVMAKSGYVSGVSCLSGFLQTKSGQMYLFSILMNGIPEGSNSSMKPLQEKIVKAVDRNGE